MKKILITGASGFLGWNLCQEAANQGYNIYGTYFSHWGEIPGINQIKIDLKDFTELKQLFHQIKPDAVIHLAAASQPNYCQKHPQESQVINVTISCNIAGICADNSIPLVFTSTDLVFNGLNPPYKETDPVTPVNIYGEQKVMAERDILEIYPLATVCRMPLMFGYGGLIAQSFIQPMLKMLREGTELNLFIDEFRTITSGKTAAKGLLLALVNNYHGILHLGGKERISRYDFIELVLDVFQIRKGKITACRQADVKMAAARPPDVSLDSSLAFSFGYQPLALREELEQLKGII